MHLCVYLSLSKNTLILLSFAKVSSYVSPKSRTPSFYFIFYFEKNLRLRLVYTVVRTFKRNNKVKPILILEIT